MFTPVGNKELLSKKVALEIESAINSQKLKVNEKLPTEFELCEQFGVSRTALREALQMLSAKGLISIEKGRGIFVRKITSESVTDPMHSYLKTRIGASYVLEIIEARRIIEPEIARSAALNRTEQDIEQMQFEIDQMATFEGPAEELAKFDMNFHLAIAKSTQNRLLPLMLKPVFRLMPEIKSMIISDVPEARNSAIIWHTKILKAIIESDADTAYEEMKQHLVLALEHAEAMLKIEGMVTSNQE
ncbi:MAG TPA: FadR/GntR family transcriptional regulator [Melioribacteraceae bacterium]|nr:FadR/GntR family transcriptional regulator [Melioribacteraceae bacterium]